ncbi:DUF982 domain-containing protein [Rhizobium sp. SEMIA 4085]|uniref:DUF982 domain-containing protein n=1 Tax=Rhizobium gallicum bv. gallicum R602sp TaxID=1041138 RepID=A0A0B4X7Q0_9HYPH|nr:MULTISPECIES: DUF982 domain-containing protein [Rhizobium]AJD42628.1 hypothetical protein RGR602_CH03319 [Rhizobium gallicum bv. gallicum R602sp]NNH31290.1 DUF982 domain-containing protein [Rhizobium sp. SEMIA 4085]
MSIEARKFSQIFWSAPVNVRAGNGFSEPIFGPVAAVEYLKHRWPTTNSPQYLSALRICAAAVERKESPDFASDAFIAASIEAAMLA